MEKAQMTHHSLFATGVLAFALGLPVAASAQHGGRIEVPAVPTNLTVDESHGAYLQTGAYGTQNYICLPVPPPNPVPVPPPPPTFAWKLFGPQATLYSPSAPMQVATHFLSPNPDEPGTARPTWQHAHDGSTVWARLVQPSSDSNYVAPGAIPWLLLEIVGRAEGPIGGALLTDTTFIHRVNTEGGVAPATGCSTAAHVGATALVPYSTDYFFYRERRNQ
jgi:hypothetical protein